MKNNKNHCLIDKRQYVIYCEAERDTNRSSHGVKIYTTSVHVKLYANMLNSGTYPPTIGGAWKARMNTGVDDQNGKYPYIIYLCPRCAKLFFGQNEEAE